jgi:antitoxin (DNA-binding transcriptional repressor) of toxin-antitoxin stability system
MKTLQQEIGSLSGREETITVTELRARPGDVLSQVELGKTFKITRCGKVIAVISKPEPNALELGAAYRSMMRNGTPLSEMR